MKGWMKLLVLGAIPILAVTMVANQGLAADKGSQLIFQSSMAHTNYISIVNANPDSAVTLLVQYYNNDMELALYYLRVLTSDSSVLVDPFNHMIPGTELNTGDEIMGSGKMGNGHFVIAVTAVADQTEAVDTVGANEATTANVLFPKSLAEDMHGTDNIDACGDIKFVLGTDEADADEANNNLLHLDPLPDGEIEACSDDDMTSANVADWGVGDAQVISFNHLTGHFTEALAGTDAGGPDQTLSWGGTPVVRPVVNNRDNDMMVNTDYQVLDGTPDAAYLAEKDAAGMGVNLTGDAVAAATGYVAGTDNEAGADFIEPDTVRTYRTIMAASGAMVLPSLSGVSGDSTQIVQFLSVADDGMAPGAYKLIPAMTAIDVTLMDAMGNPLEMMSSDADPGIVGGGTEDADADVPSTKIIVNGINVMTNAGDCDGDAMKGPWSLSNLTSLVPEATAGHGDFTGLDDGGMNLMMNGSPGWIKFARGSLECKKDYGDGDPAELSAFEQPDGIPSVDERTYTGGTLIVEEATSDRTFVTTGRAILKFVNPTSSFGASWTLKSPPSPDDADDAN